jgi:hypothetical protein
MFLDTLAFALVIGAQFLAAIYLVSNRSSIYAETANPPADESVSLEVSTT